MQFGFLRYRKSLIVLGAVLLLAGVGLWQRTSLLTWYYLRGLAAAGESERHKWIQRVISLDEAAVEGLLDCFRNDEVRICRNASAALLALVDKWPAADSRRIRLAEQLASCCPLLTLPGQINLLKVQISLATLRRGEKISPAAINQASARILQAVCRVGHLKLTKKALILADLLVDQQPRPVVMDTIHALARAGLATTDSTTRLRAAHLTRAKGLADKTDLFQMILPLLRDPSVEVRREAMRAIGLKKEVISDDDLLSWLHDPDAEVRHWCEKALLARGRSGMDIRLGRLFTDGHAKERLKIFNHLRSRSDQEPGTWVSRLLDDPSDAVRIAAARAVAELQLVDYSDRLREMAKSDRSPTVRQVAEAYYKLRLKSE